MEAVDRTRLEQEVLGAVIADPEKYLPIVTPILNGAAVFKTPGYACVYREVLKLGDATTRSNVETRLTDADWATLGWSGAVEEIADAGEFTTPARIQYAAQEIAADTLARDVDTMLLFGRQALAQGHDPIELLAEFSRRSATLRPATANRIRAASLPAPEFMAHAFPSRMSVLGSGHLSSGGFALLFGQPGLGKSYLSIQLALCVAAGIPWLGLETVQGRVGIISLELEGDQLQERLAPLNIQNTGDRLHVLCRQTLRGLLDLADPREQRDLIEWTKDLALDLVVIDPLSRIHYLEETAAELGSVVLPYLDRLRIDTGAAISLVHHERKEDPHGKGGGRDLDALRGTTRLASDPTLIMRLKRGPEGRTRLVCAKANHAPEFPDIWLDRTASGHLYAGDAPASREDRAAASKQRVADCLLLAGDWLSAADIAEAVGMTSRWVQLQIREIAGIETIGKARSTKYRLRAGDSIDPLF